MAYFIPLLPLPHMGNSEDFGRPALCGDFLLYFCDSPVIEEGG